MAKPLTYLLLLLLMVIWGFNVIAIKILVEYFAPITITAFRILTAGLVVMIVLRLRKEFRKITRQQIGYIIICSLTGYLGHHYFLATGLTMTTASNTGLILGLVPLMTSLSAILFLGDRLTLLRCLGILLGLIGVSFIVLNGSGNLKGISVGDLYIFFCVIAQAISFVFIKKATQTMDARLITGWMQMLGAVFLFLVSFQIEPHGVSTLADKPVWVWGVFFGSAILATGVGHMVYNKAIHQLGAGESAIFINLTPFFSLTGAWLFLGETIKLSQLAGFIFIVTGVVLGTGVFEHKKHHGYSSRVHKSS
ncbi:DMT family transporter [Alkalihalobacillus sp. AL-G]|uniref:DMT family transporter n=1 Tax=Alkalihalobacillus sp. AL-G TaxID=2926399 RepID=UPI00272D0F33|nr:DMT family transporter [Alkalihalobacillus sp. AL-G]WLD94549.1 DMT family transporter [Alkalihalobacillus sp. AL-G]